MSDFLNYLKRQSDTEAAKQQYNYAGVNLDRAQIYERLAQIKSQHEPLAGLAALPITERDRLYAAAHFVVYGRLPSVKSDATKEVQP